MSNIKYRNIPISADILIRRTEKEIFSEKDIYVYDNINKSIEREISHLGKEKLVIENILKLSRNLSNNKKIKNKVLYLLIRLYYFNKQVHESVGRELRNNRRLVKKRVRDKIKALHSEIYQKLRNIADKHYGYVKNYVKSFSRNKKYTKKQVHLVVYHTKKAEEMYNALLGKDIKRVIEMILLKKLNRVYESLLEATTSLAIKLAGEVTQIKKNNFANSIIELEQINEIVNEKINLLRKFALSYSYNIIHAEEYLDRKKNKIILIKK